MFLLAAIAVVRLPAQTLQTLCSFSGTNGAYPETALALGTDGNFYGTTFMGGIANSTYPIGMGTVFKVTTNGVLTTLVSFNNTNGVNPNALTLGTDGYFYGTTLWGGNINLHSGYGEGTVFKMTTNGTLTTLVYFNGTNGAVPQAALTLGTDGNLYGTTSEGGFTNGYGYGTVFKMTTNGILTTLVSFNGTNGEIPQAALTLGNDGNFYGTTYYGGISNSTYPAGLGTVFQVTTNGTLSILASFNSTNGAYPQAALTLGNDGNFYGTTGKGGSSGNGTVFKVMTNGTLSILVSFNGTNGPYPQAALTRGNDGNFYGTTAESGITNSIYPAGLGTIFQITTDGILKTLISFNGSNGEIPLAALTLGTDGNFYGTTGTGGNINLNSGYGYGTVFRLLLPPVSPVITVQPEPLTVIIGHTASFDVTTAGSPILTYQWFFNGTIFSNATNSVLMLQNAFPPNAGVYTLVVTNAYGSITSNPAMLTVLPLCIAAPKILVGGGFQFNFDTATGVDYAVEYSTNLIEWFPFVILGGNGVPLTLIDPNVASSQQRFYRITLSQH